MVTIFDVVSPGEIRAYYEALERKAYLGETLFPIRKQIGLDLSYLKGSAGSPVQLQPAAFDAVAPLRERIGVEGFNTEMPLFRERMLIREKERQELMTYLANNRSQAAEILLRTVYNDANNLVLGAHAIQERMRMQVLSTGGINIVSTAEGRQVVYDYGLTADQKQTLTGGDAWTSPTSEPLDDIDRIVSATGSRRLIMNTNTFNTLRRNPNVAQAIGDRGNTRRALLDYLAEEMDVVVAVYDEMYAPSVGATPVRFFPDNVVSFIPDGALGETVYGTTPEEADLMNGQATAAEVDVVDQGIAITTHKRTHPVNVETIVSQIVMPSFPTADKLFILTVGA